LGLIGKHVQPTRAMHVASIQDDLSSSRSVTMSDDKFGWYQMF